MPILTDAILISIRVHQGEPDHEPTAAELNAAGREIVARRLRAYRAAPTQALNSNALEHSGHV